MDLHLVNLFQLMLFIINISKASLVCVHDVDCGWNAECTQSNCRCKAGFVFSENNKDCVDSYCEDPQCVECLARQICRRCIHFVEENTGKCVDKCEGHYKLMVEGSQVGRVCQEVHQVWTPMLVAIIVGVCAAILVICLSALACYWKLKSDKERRLRFQMYHKELNKDEKKRTQKQVSEYLGFDNPAYDSPHNTQQRGHLTTLKNMSVLRRHTEKLIQMYNEAKISIQKLPIDNRMGRKYRNIAYHLGRVLLLLRDPDPSLTSESPALLEWALTILKDYTTYKQERFQQHVALDNHNMSMDTVNSVTPGSSLTRLTSAFQPDHMIKSNTTLNNGHVPGDVSPSTTTMSFTYERMPGYSTFQKDREISFIELRETYTEPVDV